MKDMELSINNSLIYNENVLIGLIYDELINRNQDINVKDILNNMSVRAFCELVRIDYLYQCGSITLDMSIKAMANLIESESIRKNYQDYLINVDNLKDIFIIEEIKYKKLIDDLYSGIISYQEYLKKYGELKELINKSMEDVLMGKKSSISK